MSLIMHRIKNIMNLEKKVCNICGESADNFTELDGRKCPSCLSLERQRIFAKVYDEYIKNKYDLKNKKCLIVAPSVSEKKIFKSKNLNNFTSLDIRPSSNIDIVGDICNMPEVDSDSFSFVYASYVLPMVYNLDNALREIKRILKPGSILVSNDHISDNPETIEITDETKLTSWYGKENFEKYKIGTFRTLGLDWQDILAKYFKVSSYHAIDPITKKSLRVFISENV